jgi:hypothetical protein
MKHRADPTGPQPVFWHPVCTIVYIPFARKEIVMHDDKNIREHMEVVCMNGHHVGEVDHVEGRTIRLTRNDPAAGGVHHWIPMDWVDRVDNAVHLNRSRDDARRDWQSAAPAPKM